MAENRCNARGKRKPDDIAEEEAEWAYQRADAMIAARNGGQADG